MMLFKLIFLFFCLYSNITNTHTYKQGELGQFPIDTNLEV